MLITILVVFFVFNYVLGGHLSKFVVSFLTRFVYGDYEYALSVYQRVFRNNKMYYCIAIVLIVFFIVLREYLKIFTEYFNEINSGIDAIIAEDSEDVVLSQELMAVEKKINVIKHTLSKRKLEAERAEQRKNDLVVYLAHDLKTPLTSVIGYLNLLHDENRISDELREKYLAITLEKAERLEDLINEFFEITRFNLSNISLEYSRVNLTRMLEQLTYEFKPMLLEKNLECALICPQNLFVKCDVDKVQRVFDNLLRNAVNYSFEDEEIKIIVRQEEERISIKFINRGNTIPQEKQERIFEQFYRLDTARSSKSGGAGLGLAIAKEIVELHGGTLSVRSENEEIEFEVILPVL
ncbi:MAG: HAMP domain-containing histidine kinase [Lachnospiraceae bacterium]|nr:HAMP domain-containing histidine kinase [Lachnospiraceae bacterium]